MGVELLMAIRYQFHVVQANVEGNPHYQSSSKMESDRFVTKFLGIKVCASIFSQGKSQDLRFGFFDSVFRTAPFTKIFCNSFVAILISWRMAYGYGTASYDCLRGLSSQVLEVFLENRSQESAESFLAFLINHQLPDGTNIDDWFRSQIAPEHLKRQVLLGFAQLDSS